MTICRRASRTPLRVLCFVYDTPRPHKPLSPPLLYGRFLPIFFLSVFLACLPSALFILVRPYKLVMIFRGTLTTREWIENASVFMVKLDGEPTEKGWEAMWNRKVRTEFIHSSARTRLRPDSRKGRPRVLNIQATLSWPPFVFG